MNPHEQDKYWGYSDTLKKCLRDFNKALSKET